MKAIIFDSSVLISLTMNGLLPEFQQLKKAFGGKFLITKDVKREIIDKPLTIKRFALEGIKLQRLLDLKVLEMPEGVGVKESEIAKITKEVTDTANNLFEARGKPVHLIDSGEASCLALTKILSEKKIRSVMAVDERTMRSLTESPDGLKKHMEQKLHTNIKADKSKYGFFKGFKFIRSAELVYVAHKKGLTRWKKGDVLDALLWAVKYKGCSISGGEIAQIKSIR